MITSKEIINQLEAALKDSGEDVYYKKGPGEVIDLGEITIELMALSAGEAGRILAEVGEHKHGVELRHALLVDMDEIDVDFTWFSECFLKSGAENL